jgi:hypothetical protein
MTNHLDKLPETDEIFAISDLITAVSRLADRANVLQCTLAVSLLAAVSQVLDRERTKKLASLATAESARMTLQ